MCFFGRSQAAAPPKTEFDDAPPVVTGSQTGIDDPIDTKKVTEQLRQDRMNKEGFSNPAESLKIAGVTGKSGMSNADRTKKKLNQDRAKHNFNKKKYSKGITGKKTGVA
tara:strand:- start:38 stop:364 length:327 start_codon:yes stop_codon:yes gene_type:complete